MAHISTPSKLDQEALRGKDKSTKLKSSGFEELLSLREAASLLGMHWKTLERRAQSGKVPAFRVFGRWRFRASVLNHWVDEKLVINNENKVQWTQPAALRESGEEQ
jgi:excisionase family DNA binding protein